MKSQTLIASLDRITLPADRREAVRQRLFAELGAAERAARTRSRAGRQRARWYACAGAAALVLALAMLLAVPGVSRAVSGWLGRLFDAVAYMGTPEAERAPHPDVDAAIQSPEAEAQSHTIYLLDETPEFESLNRLRTESGFPAYVSADWEWLRQTAPVVREALLSGGRLYVTSFLATDPTPFFVGGAEAPLWLDWLACGLTAYTDAGEAIELPLIGTGTRQAEEAGESGVLLLSEYDAGGVAIDGGCRMTQTTRILDCSIDPQGDFATVAVIEQSFPLTLQAADDPALAAGGAVQLTGTYPLTVEEEVDGGRVVYNVQAALSDVSVTASALPHTTGISVALSFHFPDAWQPPLRQALLRGLVHKWDGLRYELIIDGELVALLQPENESRCAEGEVLLEIPLTQEQQAEAETICLRPVLGYSANLLVDGVFASDLSAPYRFGTFSHYDTENESCPLT
ncbi:MAG: hypothetical protein Q4C13_08065, partial [Clostridia bacterium]|nr:hypothetical protein [Clostridia bacterium]